MTPRVRPNLAAIVRAKVPISDRPRHRLLPAPKAPPPPVVWLLDPAQQMVPDAAPFWSTSGARLTRRRPRPSASGRGARRQWSMRLRSGVKPCQFPSGLLGAAGDADLAVDRVDIGLDGIRAEVGEPGCYIGVAEAQGDERRGPWRGRRETLREARAGCRGDWWFGLPMGVSARPGPLTARVCRRGARRHTDSLGGSDQSELRSL